MPRQRSGGRAPSRPTIPARSSAPQQQTRPASTAAYPSKTAPGQQKPQQGAQGSGMLGQIASTAAGVAIGSTLGQAFGGFFGGSSEAAPADSQMNSATNQDAYGNQMTNTQQTSGAVCGDQIMTFKKCMNENGSDLTICGWYLEQLKACQQASSRY